MCKAHNQWRAKGAPESPLNLKRTGTWRRAADDVKVAVDAVSGLPDDIEEPTVRRNAWRDQVADVIIHGPVAPEQLSLFADELTALLFRKGITRTRVDGVNAPRNYCAKHRNKSYPKTTYHCAEISSAIAQEAEADPAGDVAGGAGAGAHRHCKAKPQNQSNRLLSDQTPMGLNFMSGDVASVSVNGSDARRSYFVNGNPAVSIRVDRSVDGDAIDLQAQVQAVADELQLTLPSDVKIELIRTRAEVIQDRLGLLFSNAITGLVLVVILLFLFLSARTAFWVAVGIPVALFAAVALMLAWGINPSI